MIKSVFILLLSSSLTTFASGIKKQNIILPQRKPASVTPKNATYYIGHNLTPSTDEIRAGSVTVGNFALGFAPADNVLIATSPWIWLSYNTTNLHIKYTKTLNATSDIGFFASYFDSYNSQNLMSQNGNTSGPSQFAPPPNSSNSLPSASSLTATTNRYQWTSYSAHALYGYHYDNGNIQYLNLKYSYFLNDEMPYSLRMDPGDDSIRNQFDISTLLRIPTSKSLSFALETGALGLNYINPYAHLGASFCVHDDKWMLQVGASYTAPINEIGTSSGSEVGRYDNRAHYSEIAKQYYTERYLQVAVHPEVQLQLFF